MKFQNNYKYVHHLLLHTLHHNHILYLETFQKYYFLLDHIFHIHLRVHCIQILHWYYRILVFLYSLVLRTHHHIHILHSLIDLKLTHHYIRNHHFHLELKNDYIFHDCCIRLENLRKQCICHRIVKINLKIFLHLVFL